MKKILALMLSTLVFIAGAKTDEKSGPWAAETFAGLKLRNIGPAFMSGRIADVAISPQDANRWYVAVGSGGVWRSDNAGITWQPVFDKQAVYSIGSLAIDPSNHDVVWVGSGENVGGRHVSFGDGIYRTLDGGQNWENMGLKDSQHISTIVIHPDNPAVLWVAVQGPLWSKGGDRGLYKTSDAGKNWKKVLGDDVWVGVTDVVIDPRNPDRLYAATWERHRNVAAYIGGGPGSAIHRSDDGGETWRKLAHGLPKGEMGKIGLAVSPQKPDEIYAAIELDRRTGGVYKSFNRGETWQKQSDQVGGGTGPHYYQELFVSPHKHDRLYLMDARMRVSDDGGKTFTPVNNDHKHGDNHAVAFRQDEPGFMLVGTDGGLYETRDETRNWRFIGNLPVTQFYKVALDDAEPFYNIYGGTQDNNTQGGPSRTDNVHGIRNADWYVTLFGDGHQPATEPGNPDIVYSEWQQGNLVRVDRTTGEMVYIKPQPEPGDGVERFNWDAPILVSPHQPTRLYFASQRVWKSENRGDEWTPVSGDLTRDQERIALPVHGRSWSWDAGWDLLAMSNYNTITSLAESPLQAGLLYAGTDDGLIQVSENGGGDWRKIEVGDLPGVPKTAFVNDIKADLHDVDTVYVALDNHKYGDFKPYLLKSENRGKSWKSIAGDLPENHLVWRLVQDHVKADLLFAGTEFGVFFSPDAGRQWVQLKGDVPTISFRDLAIQRRENDLVGASFGRGFFVLDDYSVLREVNADVLQGEAALFSTRKAWWYMPRMVLGFEQRGTQGANHYVAPNPPFGAVFTYYLSDDINSRAAQRQAAEKTAREEQKSVKFPGWDAVEAERREVDPVILLTVRDADGQVVRRLEGPAKKGFHRVAWDLRFPSSQAMGSGGGFFDSNDGSGMLAAPGQYSVSMGKRVDGEITALQGPVNFTVERMRSGALPGAEPQQTVAFWQQISDTQRSSTATAQVLNEALSRVNLMRQALARSQAEPGELDRDLHALHERLYDLDGRLNGHGAKLSIGEVFEQTVDDRISVAMIGTNFSTYGPTPTHRRSLDIARIELAEIKRDLEQVVNQDMPALDARLQQAGAPWTPGAEIPDLP